MSDAPCYIGDSQVRGLLTWPMAVQAVEEALRSTSANAQLDLGNPNAPFVNQPVRNITRCGQQQDELLFTMPGFVANYHPTDERGEESTQRVCTLACKLVTVFPRNEQREMPLPNILGHILLFSTSTGRLKCIMDATHITAWRTAAASIVATRVLYFRRRLRERQHRREVDFVTSPITVAIIGCGVQGESHALGMCATFKVSDVYLWNRTETKATALAMLLRSAAPHTRVHVAHSVVGAVLEADVICVGTFSEEPLIHVEMLVKRNVHINAVGAGHNIVELSKDVYAKANIYVDCLASSHIELRELDVYVRCEVGSLLRCDVNAWSPPPDGITIFQSMGIAAEDATVAQAVFDAFQRAPQ